MAVTRVPRPEPDLYWHPQTPSPDLPPTLVLLAHDHKKAQLVDLAICYRDVLARHQLITTATTGRLLSGMVGLQTTDLSSGLDGNDEEIADCVGLPSVAAVIFLLDPFTRRAHEPRIEPVLSACSLYDVPLATNLSSAGAILNLLAMLEAAGSTSGVRISEK